MSNDIEASAQNFQAVDPNQAGNELEVPKKEDKDKTSHPNLDQGWAWVVLGGYFVIQLLGSTLPAVYSLLFGYLVEEYNLSSTTLAWLFNLHQFSWNIGGLFCSPLCEQYGWRKTAVIGSTVGSICLVATPFVNTVGFLFVNSLVFGIAGGLPYAVGQLMLPHYFEKKRGLAMSLTASGVSLGQFLIPLFLNFFSSLYGSAWAARIFTATVANIIAASLLFRPVKKNSLKSAQKVESNKNNSNSASVVVSTVLNSVKKAFRGLLHPDIVIVCICTSMSVVGYYNFMVMLPFAITEKGYSAETAAFCISIGGIGSLAGRVLVGPITDILKISRIPVFLTMQAILALSVIAFTFIYSLYGIMVVIALNGFGAGTAISFQTLVLIEARGMENVGRVYGTFSITTMFLFIAVGPIIGAIRDYSESYNLANRVLALIVVTDILLLTMLKLYQRKTFNSSEKKERK